MSAGPNRSVVVVGGGPAGSMTALLLSRAGFQVQLLEKSARAHDKVCGECLSGLGIEVLSRAGLLEGLEKLNPIRLTAARLCPPRIEPIEVPLPRESMGVTRMALDEFLLKSAAEFGVAVVRSARCESIESTQSPTVTWRDLLDNSVRTIRPDVVVLADGKGLLTGRRPKLTGDIGIKTHFTNADIPPGQISLFSGPGWYGGLAPVEGGLTNAAFSVGSGRLKEFRGNIARLFDSLKTDNPGLTAALKNAIQPGEWLASPLPRFAVAGQSSTSTFAVGNAAAAIEPIGGEGMGAALRSAELVSERIAAGVSNSAVKNWRLKMLYAPRRLTCRTLARMFTSPAITGLAMPVARRVPFAAMAAAGWIGK